MRLIDADLFKQQMSALALTSPSFFTSKVVKLLEIIDKQPTVDAVPVVRGEWETVPNKVVEHGEVETRGIAERCSNCFHASPDFKKHMNFCPNCGADMRKKVDE